MLKLPKALKKKKKGKRSKRDQELFTEEELAEYKKQIQQTQQQNNKEQNDISKVNEEEQQQESCADDILKDDDEWLKFKTLTAGVDSLLHKTQDDLNRIKSTSFFQRVPPPSEKKGQTQKEDQHLEGEKVEEKKENTEQNKLTDAVVELSDLDDDSEDSDDIFDTAYIDAITNGEVQLAIVPDSPILETSEVPDPFDTSYADELIQRPAISKRGKKLVNIGTAVEVLTGKFDSTHAAASSGLKRKPRRGIQNLLLDDYDSSEIPVAPEPNVCASKSLLDDPANEVSNSIPIDLSVSLHLTLKNLEQPENKEEIVEPETFIEEPEINKTEQEEIDEFAELAADSLTKKEEITFVIQPQEPAIDVETDWAHFEQSKKEEEEESLDKKVKSDDLNEKDEFIVDDDDPFDTAFAEIVVSKSNTEKQQNNFEVKDEFNTIYINTDVNENKEKIEDLFDLSADDPLALVQVSILPITNTEISSDFDPFDTSVVETLVQPKNTELKFLEQELLTDLKLQHFLSDPDFDPRREEATTSEIQNSPEKSTFKTCNQYSNFEIIRRKSSLSLNLEAKSVTFLVPVNKEENGKVHKPLTPHCTEVLEKEDIKDPFDTSFVSNKVESRKSSLSDSDFDPRADEKLQKVEKNNLDFLVVKDQIDIKVLTPGTQQNNNSKDIEFNDPFDTSLIAANILPGKTELRLIENELLPAKPESIVAVLDTQTDVQELGLGDKVLTPQISNTELPSEEIDPFDTSFAENLKPGEAELKLLETEFIQP